MLVRPDAGRPAVRLSWRVALPAALLLLVCWPRSEEPLLPPVPASWSAPLAPASSSFDDGPARNAPGGTKTESSARNEPSRRRSQPAVSPLDRETRAEPALVGTGAVASNAPAESSPPARHALAAGALQDAIFEPVPDARLVAGGLAAAVHNRDIQLQLSFLGGLPHPINLGADLMFYRTLALGVAGGLFDASSQRVSLVDLRDVHLGIRNVEGRVRWYPLWSWFSLGISVGQEWLTINASKELTGITATATIQMRRLYLAPNLGFDWNLGKNLTLAAQLGVELPYRPSWSMDVETSGPLSGLADLAIDLGALDGVRQTVATAARSPAPYFVLRLQWNI
jgi:hypothetical protein